MPTVLVTGANRGIGLEFVRQYATDGWRVVATCRRPEAADELNALGVEVHRLDVADFSAVDALARSLAGQAVDLLVNNAGLYGERQALGGIDYAGWEQVLRVNALAPLKMVEAFLPHLDAGTGKRIACLSSKMGSMAENSSGGAYVYRSSKAALNAVVKSLALDLRGRGIAVAALHPGWVRTAMGGPGALIGPAESVAGMRRVIDGLTIEGSGHFYAYDGTEVPW